MERTAPTGMGRRGWRALAAGVLCALAAGTPVHAAPRLRWVVCYSGAPTVADLVAYDVVVLDPGHRRDLAPLLTRKRVVLAYVSLMEMVEAHAAFEEVDRAGAALHAHPDWQGSRFIDVRQPAWRALVLDQIIPNALADGYTGLFLDTLDDAAELEALDPARYGGMRTAAIELVAAIRTRFPRVTLMVNRGFDLMPAIAPHIDMLLGESVVTTFDMGSGRYSTRPETDVDWQVTAMRSAQKHNPRLQLFSLDYWDPADADGLRRIYRDQRRRGFHPYVSTPALDRLVQEP